jgi:hypothetical protein
VGNPAMYVSIEGAGDLFCTKAPPWGASQASYSLLPRKLCQGLQEGRSLLGR